MRTTTVPVLFMGMLLAFGTMHCSDAYSATVQLSPDEEADLLFMREEEKLARDTYLTFYQLYDSLTVFSNIASSEQMHMNAMLRLLKKYRLPDPAANTEIGEFTNPDLQTLYDDLIADGQTSGLDALKVGGKIEEKDMYDIQAAIDESRHDDVAAVYESLMCGSRNHLRSFANNIEALTGEPYAAQILDQTAVDEIITSPMEKCGKGVRADRNTCRGRCVGWSR